ncbi:MAG TPA: M24 family metallopeptidase [Burkholderiales bacterium]|jgi:Xaa-Pro aminopeptidase|nr:M24 family metallopeptidase [Burkholderiales bacterium]
MDNVSAALRVTGGQIPEQARGPSSAPRRAPLTPLKLEPRLRAIVQQEYPRFSRAEYERRHKALAQIMEKAKVDSLLIVTENRSGNATQWVTGWPGTAQAYVVFRPDEQMWMAVEWFNHVPLAKKIAFDAEVHWGEHQGLLKTIEELRRRGAKRLGIIGPLGIAGHRQLEGFFKLAPLNAEYIRLRTIKSQEEIDWLRLGAAMSDAGLAALLAGTEPGMTERELAALVESGYVRHGATTMIHYIGVTSMAKPHIYVPPQHPSPRKVQRGDVVFCELSASWWDYPGQVLRTFTVGADATPLYRDLHHAAEAAFDAVTAVVRHGTKMQEIIDAANVIEASGFTVCDDLMHGYGGGYLQPILGSGSRPAGPLPDMRLQENMTVVVQPNVTTREEKGKPRAGVQVGELIRVTRDGFERLHRARRGLVRVS